MNREELMTLLPHRDGMLLLDQLDKEGEMAHGQYHVRGDEWFLQGHFPDAPVVPGVILCEILAQSAGILMKEALTEDTIPMYTSMKNVRFRAPVLPGDTFETPSASRLSSPSASRRKRYVFKDPDRQPGRDRRPDHPGLQGDGHRHRCHLLPGG